MHMQKFYDACAQATPPKADIKKIDAKLIDLEPECGYSVEGYDEDRAYMQQAIEQGLGGPDT